ncbi:hypothetical protein [Domibacillus indicus]|uniref:hypothetical protein n=1 Tax=Domibacillus indicus TaxID=1437523 RepID=UPI000618211E|nr:hypothetical protein [Domibacillus indicus]
MPSSKNIDKAFEKMEFKGLAIDTYISSKEYVKRFIAEKEFTYGYKKVKDDGTLTKKFATLMMLRGVPALVLHIGERADKEGLRIQKEVDRILGKMYERIPNQIDEKTHEVFIRLDWVSGLEEIKQFIDKAYDERK